MNAELASLLQAAKETPSDDAPRLVIADWLDEHGEPERAELLRTQCHPDYPWHGLGAGLRQRADALIAEHGKRWWGTDSPVYATPVRGLLIVTTPADSLFGDGFSPALRDAWRQGWVQTLNIHHIRDRWRELADCPWLVGLAELSFQERDFNDEAATTLAASPHLATLSTLKASTCSLTSAGELALLQSPALPRLTRFAFDSLAGQLDNALRQAETTGVLRLNSVVTSSATVMDTLDRVTVPVPEVRAAFSHLHEGRLQRLLALPGLQRLFLCGNYAQRPAIQAIVDRAPPTLTHLELSFHHFNASVAMLAGAERLAGLRFLDLVGTPLHESDVVALAESPHLANLRALDLRRTALSANAVNVLARSETFPEMRRIVLSIEGLATEAISGLTSRYGSALSLVPRHASTTPITLPRLRELAGEM